MATQVKQKPAGAQPELHKPEIECALVACALMDSEAFLQDVAPADFHDSQLATLWEAGQHLKRQGVYVDAVTLEDALHMQGVSAPLTLLAELQALDVNHLNAGVYAEKVRDLAQRRQAIYQLEEAARVVYSSNGTWRDDVAAVTGRVAKLAEKPMSRAARVTSWTLAELLAAEFPEPQWAVPGIVPVGLTFLAGRPKVGKSWLSLQLALAKGSGGRSFGRQVEQGKVLYLALEDNGRRLRDRAKKQGATADCALRLETTWPRLTDGGLDRLTEAIEAEGYALVIIDTLGRAIGRADMDDYSDTTRVLGALQELAISRDMAVIVVDHHRKGLQGVDDDPVDAILGSTGKSGAADAILALTKQQGKVGARLRVTGREVEPQDLVLSWDAVTCCWQYTGTTEEVELMGRRGEVLAVLQEHYPEKMTAGEVAKDCMMHREKVIPLLNDLVREGHVTKEPKQGREQPYRATRSNSKDG